MMQTDLRFVGGSALIDNALRTEPVTVANGVIGDGVARKDIDVSGYYVLPGIIDLHGDGFERHIAPRRGALRDARTGLASVEGELAANGITTAWLAQFWSWEGGMRSPANARRFLTALGSYAGLGTDMRAQLRVETHMLDDYDAIAALIAEFGIGYAVFNDHLPHARLEAGKTPKGSVGQALRAGLNPEVYLALQQELHARAPEVPAAVAKLAARLAETGVKLGSHDDNTAEGREWCHGIGVQIGEFPETAEAARAPGAVIMGSPNVMRGGSHKGNVAAVDLIRDGLCDALASDYHYPAPVQAVAHLVADGMDFAKAWQLLCSGPASVIGLADRGQIKPGLRADLVVFDPVGTRILATMAGGRFTYLAGDMAARVLVA